MASTPPLNPTDLAISPWDHQAELILTDRPRTICIAGRRSGKTQGATMSVLARAWQRPGIYWWIGPTAIQIGVGIDTMHEVLGHRHDVLFRKSENTFYLPNGSRITYLSAAGDKSLRGRGLSGLVIDEAAFVKRSVWEQDLSPALMDKRGWAVLASTPNGINWLHDLYQATKNDPEWLHLHYPTWVNPTITEEEVRAKRTPYNESAWRQEYMGEFVASADAIWPAEYWEDVLVDSIPEAYQRSALAVDLSEGNMASDYQGIVMLGWSNHKQYLHVEALRTSGPKLLEHVKKLSDRYRPEMLVVDCSGMALWTADSFRSMWPEGGMPKLVPVKLHEHKTTRIQRLAAPLHQKLVKVLANEGGWELIREGRDFPSTLTHDDCLDAWSMALDSLIHSTAA
jgi:phage terminase large subunit-like protein